MIVYNQYNVIYNTAEREDLPPLNDGDKDIFDFDEDLEDFEDDEDDEDTDEFEIVEEEEEEK